jgi:hypothetical protein
MLVFLDKSIYNVRIAAAQPLCQPRPLLLHRTLNPGKYSVHQWQYAQGVSKDAWIFLASDYASASLQSNVWGEFTCRHSGSSQSEKSASLFASIGRAASKRHATFLRKLKRTAEAEQIDVRVKFFSAK